ncbi:MAG TPA: hypothetical protein VHC72_13190 [Bryobacteraceae bacterium]|nr:hypothetical protein [Bryobacteraceae bacterium]
MSPPDPNQNPVPEPRWPALAAGLGIGVLFYLMPEPLSVGPRWLALALIAAMFIPSKVFHQRGNLQLNDIFAYAGLMVTTIALASSLGLLVLRLPDIRSSGELLQAAVELWLSNILVFASWYWRLDGGGPNARDRRHTHQSGAFLFPQMTLSAELRKTLGQHPWNPGFVDYLFLAFNASTAFSPTDVPVLTRWAKVMMMIQSAISLGSLALVAARAVNIL